MFTEVFLRFGRPGAVPESKVHLLRQLRNQGEWQGYDPVVSTLGASDAKPACLEMDVFNPKVQRFGDAKPTSIKHPRYHLNLKFEI